MAKMMRVAIAAGLLISACCVHAVEVPCAQTVSSLPSSSPLTVAMVNEILRLHNEARYNTTPTASVMPPLQWSDDLASGAQGYLDACPGFQHSTQAYRQNKFGFAYIGENLAAGMRLDSGGFATASRMWIDERKWWTYTAPTCTGSDVCGTCTADASIGQSCGHYTQAIWSRSTHIGCGYKKCNTFEIYDCWYGPGGNIVRQGPFTAGTRDPSQTCPATSNTTAAPSGTATPLGGTTTTAAPPPSGGTSAAPTTTPTPAGPGNNNPAAPPAAGSSDDDGMSGGTVAGIVCACLVIAALLGGVLLMLVRMRRSSSANAEKSDVHEMMLASGAPSPPEGPSSGEATAGHSTRGLTTPVEVLPPSPSAPPTSTNVAARNRNGTFADL